VSISQPFIQRPVATLLLSLALVCAGLFAYRFLPVAALPRVDFPTISVSAQLPGAAPETMANSVATPLIKEFSIIPAIRRRRAGRDCAHAAPPAGRDDDAAELSQG
jgi:HAE1 family hydrophobic/amphiphilic exporter-1